MTFAMCLQVPNMIHFNNRQSIWAEFIPQILFFHSIFGYLVICIIGKWMTDWSQTTLAPPGLLNMLIYMFLSPGTIIEPFYSGQSVVQLFLLFIALVCVPWMLCVKPYLVWKEMHQHHAEGYSHVGEHDSGAAARHSNDDALENEEAGDGAIVVEEAEGGEEEHSFSDVIVHQVIHTIEFCLGAISNTASYLRLWALSLAHAQLSEVLWTMTIEKSLEMDGIIKWVALIVMGSVWVGGTIGVLCLMEGLGAFLHAMRLHW